MVPLRLSQCAARTITRLPTNCNATHAAPRAAIAARALSTSMSRPSPRIPRVNDGNGEAPPAPELGANDNYVNLLEDEDGTISIASVSLPDPTAPPGSDARTSYINLSSGVSTDQPLIILNNTIFLWNPPPLSPTAVLKNTVNARLRSQPRPTGASPVPILPGGWEAWLDKQTGQDEIWKLFEVVTPKPGTYNCYPCGTKGMMTDSGGR